MRPKVYTGFGPREPSPSSIWIHKAFRRRETSFSSRQGAIGELPSNLLLRHTPSQRSASGVLRGNVCKLLLQRLQYGAAAIS
jgi:hypothetical protein